MIQPRYTHTVAVKDNYYYVLGGRYYGKGKTGVLSSCERFDLKKQKWE